jgi:ribosome-associated translation inhibitor RaiA
MQTPLQVRFHGIPRSEALEQDVRQRAADLQRVFPRIVSCRVSIELPHRRSQQARRFRVQVDVGVPRTHLIAGTAPGADPAHEDVYLAVRDAFTAARRRLEEHANRLHADAGAPALDQP